MTQLKKPRNASSTNPKMTKFSDQEYKMLYPSKLSPGKLYFTTEVHELPKNGNADQLPIAPFVSNLNMAT